MSKKREPSQAEIDSDFYTVCNDEIYTVLSNLATVAKTESEMNGC